MELRKAIARASKFTWRGKQASALKCLRFIPSEEDEKPRLMASNGSVTVLINLDSDVPNVLLDGAKVAAIAKSTKELSFGKDLQLGGVKLDAFPFDDYPSVPEFPARCHFRSFDDWFGVEQVLHAVSEKDHRRVLRCVRMGPDVVETTDGYRLARSFVETGLTQTILVDSKDLKNWPKGPVSYKVLSSEVAFRVGDETRFVPYMIKGFRDCDAVLPAQAEGEALIVDVSLLQDLVRRAKTVGGTVDLVGEPGGSRFVVRIGDFVDHVPAEPVGAMETEKKARVNADWLLKALSVVRTPRVLMRFGDVAGPLRVESGPYVEGIWQIGL